MLAKYSIRKVGKYKFMFDFNKFKKAVKEWIHSNPSGSINDLRDFCEELIPPAQYSANEWIISQTLSWYNHILDHRKFEKIQEEGVE